MRVDLFIPCFVDQLAPRVGLATAKVLRGLGHEVAFREAQTCCGQPSFNSGHWDVARDAALRALDVFRGAEAVVGPSASCVAMMRKFYPEVLAGHPRAAEAAELASRTFELGEFLVKRLGVTDICARWEGKATYHDGCHGLRELGLRAEARRLLGAVKGLTLVEAEEQETCCGFGGLFSVKFPMISTAMAQVKSDALVRTGADIVVSSDPSCLLQIGGYLGRQGKAVRTLHLAEVLASR